MKFRKEYDSIGSINVPVDKYWGASTQRSKKYFDIGDVLVRPKLIKSIALDCDNDTLLVRVEQSGAACHNGTRSCFINIGLY